MGKRLRHQAIKKQAKEIAKDSIKNLFLLAKENFGNDPKLSDRYVQMARRIAMKAGTRIPSIYRRQFCRYCYSYLMPGKNCRVRTNKKTISYYCFKCRRFNRMGYKADSRKRK